MPSLWIRCVHGVLLAFTSLTIFVGSPVVLEPSPPTERCSRHTFCSSVYPPVSLTHCSFATKHMLSVVATSSAMHNHHTSATTDLVSMVWALSSHSFISHTCLQAVSLFSCCVVFSYFVCQPPTVQTLAFIAHSLLSVTALHRCSMSCGLWRQKGIPQSQCNSQVVTDRIPEYGYSLS